MTAPVKVFEAIEVEFLASSAFCLALNSARALSLSAFLLSLERDRATPPPHTATGGAPRRAAWHDGTEAMDGQAAS